MRWRRDALDCLQEAAEDFLIEFFQDSYICAAHAKRVTLMDKDFVTLRRLRYRFSKLLEPVPFRDEKTFNILNIPPYRKPKPGEAEIKIEEVTHERETRLSRQAEMQKKEASEAKRKEKGLVTQQKERDMCILLEDELPKLLGTLNPDGFLVRAFSEDDALGRDDYITLDKESLIRLKDKSREVNDTIVLASMRFAMLEFPMQIQSVIEIIDSSISHYMRVEPDILDLERWVANVNMEKVELILIPYNENSHWSLIGIDLMDKVVYYINTLPGQHGLSQLATKRFLELLQTFDPMPKDLVTTMQHKRAQVPIQQDGHSCGWRISVNAIRLVEFLYMNVEDNIYFSPDCYNDDHVWLVRARIIKHMVLKNLPLQEKVVPDDPNETVEEISGPSNKNGGSSKGRERKKKQTKIKFSFKAPKPKDGPSAKPSAGDPTPEPLSSAGIPDARTEGAFKGEGSIKDGDSATTKEESASKEDSHTKEESATKEDVTRDQGCCNKEDSAARVDSAHREDSAARVDSAHREDSAARVDSVQGGCQDDSVAKEETAAQDDVAQDDVDGAKKVSPKDEDIAREGT